MGLDAKLAERAGFSFCRLITILFNKLRHAVICILYQLFVPQIGWLTLPYFKK